MHTQSLVAVINTLQTGKVNLTGQSIMGSNFSALVTCQTEDQVIQAIYKPDKGERPLWDFPRFTLARREVAAFIVSHLLGWDLVPPTVHRTENLPYGAGSLQLFIPHNPEVNYFNLPQKDHLVLKKFVLFDMLINNADRKGGHMIVDPDNRYWSIDHGLSFSQEYKLRTVIWEYAGSWIPSQLLMDIQNLLNILQLKKYRLARKLGKMLSKHELNALEIRGKQILQRKQFPFPDNNRRSYPWPPI